MKLLSTLLRYCEDIDNSKKLYSKYKSSSKRLLGTLDYLEDFSVLPGKVKVYTQTGKTFTLAKFNREKFLNNLQTVVNKLKLLFNKQDYNDSLVQSRKKTLTQREVLFGRVEGYSASEGFKSTYKLNSLDTEQTPVQPKTVEELEKRSQKLGYEIQQQKNKLGRS